LAFPVLLSVIGVCWDINVPDLAAWARPAFKKGLAFVRVTVVHRGAFLRTRLTVEFQGSFVARSNVRLVVPTGADFGTTIFPNVLKVTIFCGASFSIRHGSCCLRNCIYNLDLALPVPLFVLGVCWHIHVPDFAAWARPAFEIGLAFECRAAL